MTQRRADTIILAGVAFMSGVYVATGLLKPGLWSLGVGAAGVILTLFLLRRLKEPRP